MTDRREPIRSNGSGRILSGIVLILIGVANQDARHPLEWLTLTALGITSLVSGARAFHATITVKPDLTEDVHPLDAPITRAHYEGMDS
jgi:hypothetical protein